MCITSGLRQLRSKCVFLPSPSPPAGLGFKGLKRMAGKEPRSLNHHVEETVLYTRGPQRLCHRPILGHGLLGPGPHSRRWATGKQAKLHLYLQALPITCITAWAPSPVRWAVASDSQSSANPTVKWTCEGSRLCTPCETWIPSDLRWSWGGNASTREWLQIQIIIRQAWLHRDHNKSIACRLISKPIRQWQVTSCNWWQALTQNPTYFSLCMAHSLLYLPLLPMPLSCTEHLSQSQFW